MARAFHSLGYTAVTYNFRGVGKSEGEYDHGVGEQDDLMAVVAWAKETFAIEQVTLAGFSFGSYVALKSGHFFYGELVWLKKIILLAF
ncbi:Alpha/beta hydrolase [hydrothermal vent metagenome]|uniref:Alpha/beta hydrolase n=1 Tax=hydrothermal vent metagenome TaxID=652676 RepID=A0A3B0WZK4_9ZZZZ